MEIYRYESIEAVNHGINKLEGMGWGVIDVEIKLCVIPNTMDVLKGSTIKEMFYVYVEKDIENFEKTLEKSLISRDSLEDNL